MSNKLCVSCGHHEDVGQQIPEHRCNRLKESKLYGKDPVTGEELPCETFTQLRCNYERCSASGCGPLGNYWKPKELKKDD